MTMDYTVVIERADDHSFSVYVPDLPGCMSSGDSVEQALEMIKEAIRGHIESLRQQDEPIPEPRSTACVVHAA